MGRKRKGDNAHLPPGVYFNKGSFSFRDPETGKSKTLGQSWDRAAKQRWIELSTGKAAEGTVAELLDAFYAHCDELVRQGKRSKDTHRSNGNEMVSLKSVFGTQDYRDVNGKHCATYLNKRKDKHGRPTPTRANREIAFLSSAYSWAMGQDAYDVSVNPCYGVRRNPEKKRLRYVTSTEFRQFTKGVYQADGTLKRYVPQWMRAYAWVKLITGLTQSDMLDLDDSHLTARGIYYIRNKTRLTDGRPNEIRWSRALRIAVEAAKRLRRALPENVTPLKPRPLFPSRFDTHQTGNGFRILWQRAMVKYAKDGFERFWEHDIRAKTASDIKNIEDGRKLLNHKTQGTTAGYQRAPRKVRPLR